MLLLRALVLLLAVPAFAQSWNSNAGGWSTGYGTVYGSFGVAMATQNIYNTTQMQIQRLTMRQAMIKQFGLAAVEKAEREAASGKKSSAPEGLTVTAPPPAPKNSGVFKPGKATTVARQLGDSLGSTPEEKAAVAQIAEATRQAFEAQPETQKWKNNVAGALAFFILSNVVIATDSPEPSDEASQALFQAVGLALDSTPELAKASAKEKQQLYDLLIGFTGVPLAIYTEAKERGDEAQVKQARELAAQLVKLVLKVEAKSIKLQ